MAVFTAREWFEHGCGLKPPVTGIRGGLNENLMLVGMGEHVQISLPRFQETCGDLPDCVLRFLNSRTIEEFADLFSAKYVGLPVTDNIVDILEAGAMAKFDFAQVQVLREIAEVRVLSDGMRTLLTPEGADPE